MDLLQVLVFSVLLSLDVIYDAAATRPGCRTEGGSGLLTLGLWPPLCDASSHERPPLVHSFPFPRQRSVAHLARIAGLKLTVIILELLEIVQDLIRYNLTVI